MAGPIAGGMLDIEFATGRWALGVDTAGHRLANGADQRHAARRGAIGAAQANDAGGDQIGRAHV